ncbi:hypothetical protein GCM10009811_11580 [Nostocoides veronense]|uniref:Uncharacterized protein n=1 Tax=Nostocoides veronense TaxID=330836 RepID=A0ABP4XME5_9MICO
MEASNHSQEGTLLSSEFFESFGLDESTFSDVVSLANGLLSLTAQLRGAATFAKVQESDYIKFLHRMESQADGIALLPSPLRRKRLDSIQTESGLDFDTAEQLWDLWCILKRSLEKPPAPASLSQSAR